jgi:hypothetical protein
MNLDEEINLKVPNNLKSMLRQRDGGALLAAELPKVVTPAEASDPESELQRAWELCGQYFAVQDRLYDAQAIFHSLYDQMLKYQEETDRRVHKGMPLIWISDYHARLGHPALSKRYLLLSTCEDAIRDKGEIPAETTGVYFRAVWRYGMSHHELARYAKAIWDLSQNNPVEARYPEWVLQEIGNEWITEYPSASEILKYKVSTRYVRQLLGLLGSGDGKHLERLAHYILESMPGCRAYMRKRSHSTDYDVVCTFEGPNDDFRLELGRYFIGECKDWNDPADFSAIAKFCRVLDSVKCRFGILFSREGITGTGKTKDAERELVKVFQDRGMVIIVITKKDLQEISEGANLITMVRSKYEAVRLDLRK